MASPRRFLLRVHPEVERGSVDFSPGPRDAARLAAFRGGGEEVRALPAAQLNSGGPYHDAPPTLVETRERKEIEELETPGLFDRHPH